MRRASGSVVAAVSDDRRVPGTKRPGKPKDSITFQLLMLEGSVAVVTLGVLGWIGANWPGIRELFHIAVAASLGVYAIAAFLEAIAAARTRRIPVADEPMPPVTGILVAYLPNEATIIADTIEHHLAAAPEGYQLIVAYNTPEPLEVEAVLYAMAATDPRLFVLRVDGSRSKAENVNTALPHATGEIVGIFDADHHPAADAYERAWCSLSRGADVVQGRCVIRRPPGSSKIAWMVAAELEQMYRVGHPGRANLYGFGLFGGSNGYWHTSVLKRTPFDDTMMTEDVDASVRVIGSGGRIAIDPLIVSTELAPTSLRALCHQRIRWGQGWFQVRLKHLATLRRARHLQWRQRVGALWMFGFGSVTPWLAALVLPLWIDLLMDPSPAAARVVGAIAMFGTIAFLSQVLVAYRHALPATRKPLLFIAYFFANAAFYGYLRVALVRLSHIHQAAGNTVWRVTPRR